MNNIEFVVPGVPREHTWQLLNMWWYSYYRKKVKVLQDGICEFCQLDRTLNQVLDEDEYWRLWENKVSPLPGQSFQFVIASVRHLVHFDSLNDAETIALRNIIARARFRWNLTGYTGLVRSGDYRANAKTVDHLHFNIHVANGTVDVRPFIGKDGQTIINNLPVLAVFEKMRLLQESGVAEPFRLLNQTERDLVKDRLAPPQK